MSFDQIDYPSSQLQKSQPHKYGGCGKGGCLTNRDQTVPTALPHVWNRNRVANFPLGAGLEEGCPVLILHYCHPYMDSSTGRHSYWKKDILGLRLWIFFSPLCVCVRTCTLKGLCTPTWIGGGGSSIRGFLRSCWFSSLLYQGKKKRNIAYMACSGFPKSILINLVAKIKNIRNKTTTQFYMFLHTSDACLSRIQQAVPVINTIKIIPSTRHTS